MPHDQPPAPPASPAAQGSARLVGRVVRLDQTRDKGFGFVVDSRGEEYFLHRNGCRPATLFDELVEGDYVAFAWMPSPKGLRAVDVSLSVTAEEQRAYEEEERRATAGRQTRRRHGADGEGHGEGGRRRRDRDTRGNR